MLLPFHWINSYIYRPGQKQELRKPTILDCPPSIRFHFTLTLSVILLCDALIACCNRTMRASPLVHSWYYIVPNAFLFSDGDKKKAWNGMGWVKKGWLDLKRRSPYYWCRHRTLLVLFLALDSWSPVVFRFKRLRHLLMEDFIWPVPNSWFVQEAAWMYGITTRVE